MGEDPSTPEYWKRKNDSIQEFLVKREAETHEKAEELFAAGDMEGLKEYYARINREDFEMLLQMMGMVKRPVEDEVR